MMPPCDQTGTPGLVGFTHFHSSTTSGSASLMRLRMRLSVFPRQSPRSAIRCEMRSGAGLSFFALGFFMCSLRKLFGVLGIQPLPAFEFQRVAGHDAADGGSTEQ